MVDDRLLSLLQVSDLHFGDLLPNGDAALPPWLGSVPLMTGLLGHHRLAAKDLQRFFADRRERGEAEVLVVSGDVTANGAVAQFDLARSFLGSGAPHPAFGLTLGVADWVETGISGNHDRWPGSNRIVGHPTPGLAATFPHAFPFVRRFQTKRGPKVTFVMLDSDADVAPVSYDRVFARGAFTSQLRALGEILPEPEPDEVRVMVIHHSIADATVPDTPGLAVFPRRGRGSPWLPLEIASDSLLALEQALVDHGIRIVMTGHIHVPRLVEYSATNAARRGRVFETRCGTTTQRDVYPAGFLARGPGPFPLDPLPPNTLVMHELARRGRDLVWKAEVYWRAPGRGFVAGTGPGKLPATLARETIL